MSLLFLKTLLEGSKLDKMVILILRDYVWKFGGRVKDKLGKEKRERGGKWLLFPYVWILKKFGGRGKWLLFPMVCLKVWRERGVESIGEGDERGRE
jgi:hypothetical protein